MSSELNSNELDMNAVQSRLVMVDLITVHIGKRVICRTPAGFTYAGVLVAASPRNIALTECVWIADVRWGVAVTQGVEHDTNAAVEAWPVDEVVVIDRPAGFETSTYRGKVWPLVTR